MNVVVMVVDSLFALVAYRLVAERGQARQRLLAGLKFLKLLVKKGVAGWCPALAICVF